MVAEVAVVLVLFKLTEKHDKKHETDSKTHMYRPEYISSSGGGSGNYGNYNSDKEFRFTNTYNRGESV